MTAHDPEESPFSIVPVTRLAWIGLGGNRPDTLARMRRALARLDQRFGVTLLALSPIYRTQPVGPIRHQPWFWNGVAALACRLTGPRALLRLLQRLEREAGRDRRGEIHGGPRPLDLDLLFFGSRVIRSRSLILPHPRLHQRRFVLAPLADLAPGWIHPTCGKTIDRLLDEVDDTARIIRLERMGVDSDLLSWSRDPDNRIFEDA
ncbi:MAG: 2-amino-4-hydroxy-6-hydroxymethyldihydropteridine diphosphokinase [Magnetococcales bacterium]|nr:2-amino-4-hydroxy-6-hydroxymethyldihydropteridine diphosphokinase [Magnetococcales bacterium]MBF0262912.1 2-amino-4-hydroxy-6-hydroxymethyldihydropteridine diphosphokinase [Magnetococcales bacterium]